MASKDSDKAGSSQVSDEEIGDLYDGAKEVESSNELSNSNDRNSAIDPGLAEVPGVSAVNSLLNLTPFTSWIDHRAIAIYKHSTVEGRVYKYAQDHKWIVGICNFLELGFRAILAFILIGLLVLFGLKALLPLPDLFAV